MMKRRLLILLCKMYPPTPLDICTSGFLSMPICRLGFGGCLTPSSIITRSKMLSDNRLVHFLFFLSTLNKIKAHAVS